MEEAKEVGFRCDSARAAYPAIARQGRARGADCAIDLLVRHLQPFASGNDGDLFVAPPVVGFGERPDSRGKLFGHALGLAARAPRLGRRSCMPARAGNSEPVQELREPRHGLLRFAGLRDY